MAIKWNYVRVTHQGVSLTFSMGRQDASDIVENVLEEIADGGYDEASKTVYDAFYRAAYGDGETEQSEDSPGDMKEE